MVVIVRMALCSLECEERPRETAAEYRVRSPFRASAVP
jgi:hypothetical protein